MENEVLQRIRTIIKNEKISQKSFGEKADISENTLKSMFNKGTNPSVDVLVKLSHAFPHYSLEWMLKGEGRMLLTEDVSRESDNNLYHFTNEYTGFINIFNEKIKPQYSTENLGCIFGNGNCKMAFPIFCFCDIPIERLDQHKGKYGSYGIGFKKEWAVKNNMSPITYVHAESYCSSFLRLLSKYFSSKNNDQNKDESFCGAYRYFNYLLMLYKQYEDENARYYDEKEWRWIPLYDDVSLSIIESKNNEIEKHQNIINNRDDIKLDFNIDDIAYISLKSISEKDKFLKDVREVYKGDVGKIADLIDNSVCYNSGRDTNINNGDNRGIVGDASISNMVVENSGNYVAMGEQKVKKIMESGKVAIEMEQSAEIELLRQRNESNKTRINDLLTLIESKEQIIETYKLLIDNLTNTKK